MSEHELDGPAHHWCGECGQITLQGGSLVPEEPTAQPKYLHLALYYYVHPSSKFYNIYIFINNITEAKIIHLIATLTQIIKFSSR